MADVIRPANFCRSTRIQAKTWNLTLILHLAFPLYSLLHAFSSCWAALHPVSSAHSRLRRLSVYPPCVHIPLELLDADQSQFHQHWLTCMTVILPLRELLVDLYNRTPTGRQWAFIWLHKCLRSADISIMTPFKCSHWASLSNWVCCMVFPFL